ncbi:jg27512 [Pararge aegeria aegeria]|uniref:Jg27512 protein n=1 Tax=Pararge aegeria aegeria TaxID=348720 RepID=A0A8S4SM15_9NEOP|nr:jg27512 [Pararge aegeria aegeria]
MVGGVGRALDVRALEQLGAAEAALQRLVVAVRGLHALELAQQRVEVHVRARLLPAGGTLQRRSGQATRGKYSKLSFSRPV